MFMTDLETCYVKATYVMSCLLLRRCSLPKPIGVFRVGENEFDMSNLLLCSTCEKWQHKTLSNLVLWTLSGSHMRK